MSNEIISNLFEQLISRSEKLIVFGGKVKMYGYSWQRGRCEHKHQQQFKSESRILLLSISELLKLSSSPYHVDMG